MNVSRRENVKKQKQHQQHPLSKCWKPSLEIKEIGDSSCSENSGSRFKSLSMNNNNKNNNLRENASSPYSNIILNCIHFLEYDDYKLNSSNVNNYIHFWTNVRMYTEIQHKRIVKNNNDLRAIVLSTNLLNYAVLQELLFNLNDDYYDYLYVD
jgi:hypothetical protein